MLQQKSCKSQQRSNIPMYCNQDPAQSNKYFKIITINLKKKKASANRKKAWIATQWQRRESSPRNTNPDKEQWCRQCIYKYTTQQQRPSQSRGRQGHRHPWEAMIHSTLMARWIRDKQGAASQVQGHARESPSREDNTLDDNGGNDMPRKRLNRRPQGACCALTTPIEPNPTPGCEQTPRKGWEGAELKTGTTNCRKNSSVML